MVEAEQDMLLIYAAEHCLAATVIRARLTLLRYDIIVFKVEG